MMSSKERFAKQYCHGTVVSFFASDPAIQFPVAIEKMVARTR